MAANTPHWHVGCRCHNNASHPHEIYTYMYECTMHTWIHRYIYTRRYIRTFSHLYRLCENGVHIFPTPLRSWRDSRTLLTEYSTIKVCCRWVYTTMRLSIYYYENEKEKPFLAQDRIQFSQMSEMSEWKKIEFKFSKTCLSKYKLRDVLLDLIFMWHSLRKEQLQRHFLSARLHDGLTFAIYIAFFPQTLFRNLGKCRK